MNDYIDKIIELAKRAYDSDDIPVGAIVVKNNDTNKTKTFSDYSISVRRKRIKITSSDISALLKRIPFRDSQSICTSRRKSLHASCLLVFSSLIRRLYCHSFHCLNEV